MPFKVLMEDSRLKACVQWSTGQSFPSQIIPSVLAAARCRPQGVQAVCPSKVGTRAVETLSSWARACGPLFRAGWAACSPGESMVDSLHTQSPSASPVPLALTRHTWCDPGRTHRDSGVTWGSESHLLALEFLHQACLRVSCD